MKYSYGELVVDTFCQWSGRDEVTACREKIPPYPYAGTIKKSCCEFHQYAFALSYSIEEIQRIIRFKIGNPAWMHPLRFTDIINSTLMALKGADIDSIVSEVYSQAAIHYRLSAPIPEESLSEQSVKQYIKGLLNAFFMFPIVYDRFFAPRVIQCGKNPELPLLSPSILSLADPRNHLLPSDIKMISSDLKYNALNTSSIALSWGFRTSMVDEIHKEYKEANTPPAKEVAQAEPSTEKVEEKVEPQPAKAPLTRDQVEEELKSGRSVIIEVDGVKCRLSPIKEDLKKTYTEHLPLSQRLINVLVANKLNNLFEIAEYFDGLDREAFMQSDKFMQLHNFGRKSAMEIFEFLSTLQGKNENTDAKKGV